MSAVVRLKAELERRGRSLTSELARWKTAAQDNVAGFGIHRNQVNAIDLMITSLDERHRARIAALDTSSTNKFAEPYLECIGELVGLRELWSVFQEALLQRSDPAVKPMLDASDLVAADAYHSCIEVAVSWGILSDDKTRPPPLTLLEPRAFAATVAAGDRVGLLGHPQSTHRDEKLTVPVVLMPPDQLEAMWLLTTIFHEVGHSIDQDLALTAGIKSLINDLDAANTFPGTTSKLWFAWTSEMVADAIGVLLGGSPFVEYLGETLLAVVGSPRYAEVDRADPHPNVHVRALLLCDLLDSLAIPSWSAIAQDLRARWKAMPHPAWVQDFEPHVGAIAEVLIAKPLPALGGHAIGELVPRPTLAQLRSLGDHFLKDMNPPDAVQDDIRHRFIPAGAALAFSASDGSDTALDAIHTRALAYVHDKIKRPSWLDTAVDNRKYLEELTASIDVRRKV